MPLRLHRKNFFCPTPLLLCLTRGYQTCQTSASVNTTCCLVDVQFSDESNLWITSWIHWIALTCTDGQFLLTDYVRAWCVFCARVTPILAGGMGVARFVAGAVLVLFFVCFFDRGADWHLARSPICLNLTRGPGGIRTLPQQSVSGS